MPERRLLIRFGIFELDCASGKLWKHGVRIKLEDQPFRLLVELSTRQGEVLTRAELKKALRTEGICVDLDRSLTRAVNKVRIALGDTADNPRFIETLPRRGYRFVAPVSVANLHDTGLRDVNPVSTSAISPAQPSQDLGIQAGTKRRWAAAVLIATGVMTLSKWLLPD